MKGTTFKNGSIAAKKPRKKWLIFALLLLIVFGAIVGGVLYKRYYDNKQQALQKERDESQTESAKKAVSKSSDSDIESSGLPENSNSITSDQVPNNSSVKLAVASVNQANGMITVSGTISGTSQNGTCVFSFTKPENKPVVKQVQSSASSCSVQIPEAEFTMLGSWTLLVTHYVNGTKTEVQREVTIT